MLHAWPLLQMLEGFLGERLGFVDLGLLAIRSAEAYGDEGVPF
jgi:hypothetical protein